MGIIWDSLEQRFWAKVRVGGIDECWPWLAGTYQRGYGKFKIPAGELEQGKTEAHYAHRVAFRLIYGWWPTPAALHGCDNVQCCNAVNPDHVHEGTQAQNLREMTARGRRAHGAVLATRAFKLMDAETAQEIRTRRAEEAASYQAIADEFGISISFAWKIVNGPHFTERA